MKKLLCLCLLIVIMLCSCGKSDTVSEMEESLDALINFSYKGDLSNVRCLAPDEYWEKLEKDVSMTYNEILDLAEQRMEEEKAFEKIEERFGTEYEMSYEVVKKEPIEEAELNALKSDVLYNTEDPKIQIDDAMRCDVEITIKGMGNENKQKDDFMFVKYGDEWYIYYDEVGFAAIAIVMVAVDFTWE